MKLFGYYSDVPEHNQVDELRLTVLWRQRWEAAAWDPFILGERDAQQHSLYKQLHEAVSRRPSVNPRAYEVACHERWLALAMAGGGFMADFDVIPFPGEFGISIPEMTGADMAKLHIYQERGACPSFTFAMPDTCEQLAQVFIEGKIGRRDQGGRPHFSDQYTLEDLLIAKVDWVVSHDLVRCYGQEGWKSASLVHFANAYCKPSRWQNIPKLR